MSRKSKIIIWALFAVFLLIRLTMEISTAVVLDVMVCVIGAVTLKQAGLPSKRRLWLSIAFSVTAAAAYLGYQQSFPAKKGPALSAVRRCFRSVI